MKIDYYLRKIEAGTFKYSTFEKHFKFLAEKYGSEKAIKIFLGEKKHGFAVNV